MQSEMHFGLFATAVANHVRRLNAPPLPDSDGMFDIDGVAIICGRRQCCVDADGDLFTVVQFQETRVRLTATAPGRWDPISILAACTRAHGNLVYEVDYDRSEPSNLNGLD